MAIIIREKTLCAICGKVLRERDEIVATSHFIQDKAHWLWRYSDAGMHKTCFVRWEHRDEFRNLFNETAGTVVWGSGHRHHMQPDGTIVETNLDK